MLAFCWANGVVEFGRTLPDGAITMASGPARPLRKCIEATSRLAYDGKTLLVPGIPEAPNQAKAGDALMNHLEWLRKCELRRRQRERTAWRLEFGAMKPRRKA